MLDRSRRSSLRRAALQLSIATALLATPAAELGAQAAGDTTRARAWYERLTLRGYAQARYNRLLETNPELQCAQCDRSIGRNGGFSLRRARLVISGDVHPRISIYIQPDFAAEVSGNGGILQMRDLYGDVYLDAARTLRLRLGQSKVPFGWENLQSSSNRIPFDRADPLNSGLPNERDLGVFAMWTPAAARRHFRILTDSGLKGTGDYGVLSVGVYNGQTANRPEANDGRHLSARVSYPFRLPNGQFVEAGVQGYRGRFVLLSRTTGVSGPSEFDDERVALSLVVFPQPIGVQAEWNAGRGPEYVPASNLIEERRLEGGYLQVMHRTSFDGQPVIPFARWQYYQGGKKAELDARRHDVREWEFGAEWTPMRALELTASYVVSDRRFEDAVRPENRQRGQFLRLQAQFNY